MNLKEKIEKFRSYVVKNRKDFNNINRAKYNADFIGEAESQILSIEFGLEIIKKQQEIIRICEGALLNIESGGIPINFQNKSDYAAYILQQIEKITE